MNIRISIALAALALVACADTESESPATTEDDLTSITGDADIQLAGTTVFECTGVSSDITNLTVHRNGAATTVSTDTAYGTKTALLQAGTLTKPYASWREFQWAAHDDVWGDSGYSYLRIQKKVIAGKAGRIQWLVNDPEAGPRDQINRFTCTPKAP